MLALTGKLMVKDRLTREAAAGFAKRVDYMGVGLVGRTFGSLGIGNIGAETVPPGQALRHEVHRPRSLSPTRPSPRSSASSSSRSRSVFRQRRLRLGQLPADAGDAPPRQCRAHRADEADRLPDQHGARADRRPEGAHRGAAAAAHRRRRARCARDRSRPIATTRSCKLDNVILTPHALCWTDQCFAGNGAADVRAVLDVQHGREPRGVVNREVLANAALEAAGGSPPYGGRASAQGIWDTIARRLRQTARKGRARRRSGRQDPRKHGGSREEEQ